MSRGLSQQQRLILGLAVAMSRHHYGSPKAHIPQADPGWRIPVGFTDSPPDVTAKVVAHFIHGIPIEYWKRYRTKMTGGEGALKLTPEARAAINSASRAIRGMYRSGLLCYRGYRAGEYSRQFTYGYLLTAAGLAIGRQYEIELPADIDHRLTAFKWINVETLGFTKWGRDKAIPLTFEHPNLLRLDKCLRGSDREPNQHIDHGERVSA